MPVALSQRAPIGTVLVRTPQSSTLDMGMRIARAAQACQPPDALVSAENLG